MGTPRMPVLFLSHGPGPAWLLDGVPMLKECDKNSESAKYLKQLRETVLSKYEPIKAVLVVSAHWDEPTITVQSVHRPELYYDYGGFPKEAYKLTWCVPGAPDVAQRIEHLLKGSGLDCHVDSSRGLDHGVFVPLMLLFQKADVPVLQVSLRSDWDMSAHLQLGETLSALRNEGVMIVASGQTTHNTDRNTPSSSPPEWASEFRNWIHDTLTNEEYSGSDRKRRFMASSQQRTFRKAHPTMDHYLPIPVASAAAGYRPAKLLYEQYVMRSLLISHYLFDD